MVAASEAATGGQVMEVLGDCAYGAGETRAGVRRGWTHPDRQSARYLQNQGYFAKTVCISAKVPGRIGGK